MYKCIDEDKFLLIMYMKICVFLLGRQICRKIFQAQAHSPNVCSDQI